MGKVTIVGAGNVGATCANVLAHQNITKEIVLLDIQGDLARGKALDTWQQASIDEYSSYVKGTDDYTETADSDIVVITAGIPRKPGMSRDDLISTNAKIVKSVTESIMQHSKDPIIIIVSNPLDVMSFASFKTSGLKANRVFGMAGILDTARYRAFLATAIGVSPRDIQAMLLGGHGDTMVPLVRYTTVSGIPVTDFLSNSELEAIIQRTKVGGGELVKLMGTSAWYAPGAAAAQMVTTILKDENRIFPCCAYLEGEYGLNGLFLGVPVKLGRRGIEKIIELNLNQDELAALHSSADHVREVLDTYKAMDI